MPAGGSWGTFNPYTHQQQNSQGRGWGSNVYRGGQRQSQQQGGYQQPPMPYSGAGAWGQNQSQGGGGYPQRPPQRSGGGGGIGGGLPGMGIGGRGSYGGSGQLGNRQGTAARHFEKFGSPTDKLQQMQQWYGPMQQMFGQSQGFQPAWMQAVQSFMDPWAGRQFDPSDFFGNFNPGGMADSPQPNSNQGGGNPWMQGAY